MATKGASYRYGNTRGSKHQGEVTKHINYAWAKDFNRGGIDQHFRDHGKEFGAKTVYTSLLLPVVLGIFEKIVPDVP